MSRPSFPGQVSRWLLAFFLCSIVPASVSAKELKLEAKLIWGTNEEKSPEPAHKPIDPATAEKLRKVFKWKNYFVVTNQVKMIPSRGSNRFDLSKQCVIEVTELEGAWVEVKLIGEGKEINKTKKTLNKGESFTYGKDDKNDNAWFVIITELDEK
jgi:hypothetical protein